MTQLWSIYDRTYLILAIRTASKISMCTVSYIPSPNGDFTITANRDEKAERNALSIESGHSGSHGQIYFPQDKTKRGSWIIAATSGRVAVLLNGAFKPYPPDISYDLSRGLMLMELFEYSMTDEFIAEFPFQKTAPFTLLIAEQGLFEELRFDGNKVHHTVKDPDLSYIYSSATLYKTEIHREREKFFYNFICGRPDIQMRELFHFHTSCPFNDGYNDFQMKRESGTMTVSITQVKVMKKDFRLVHHDLIKPAIFQQTYKLRPEKCDHLTSG